MKGQFEFGIFIGNYLLSFLLLILGLIAPGLMTPRDYFSLHNSSDLFLDVSFMLILINNHINIYIYFGYVINFSIIGLILDVRFKSKIKFKLDNI